MRLKGQFKRVIKNTGSITVVKVKWECPGGGVLVSISILSQRGPRPVLFIRKVLACDWLTSHVLTWLNKNLDVGSFQYK